MSGLYILLGVFIGAVLASITYGIKSRGHLIIDNSDPEQAYMFIELSKTDVPGLMHSRYVILRIVKRK